MQPTFSSSRILLPVRPWFIFLSLIVALLLNFLPTAHWPGMPDWVALVLCFWGVREFRRVGMGWAFILGLLMDVADGSVLGQHCFAYVLLAFLAASQSRRLLWFPLLQQALQVLPLFAVSHAVEMLIRLAAGGIYPGAWSFLTPVLEALLWPLASWVLLAPQRRPPDRDQNRPL